EMPSSIIPSSSSSSLQDMDAAPPSRSWWRWRWRFAPVSVIGQDDIKMEKSDLPPSQSPPPPIPILKTGGRREEKAPVHMMELTGWERIRALYEKPSMEREVVERVARMSFFGGFVVGGSNGYLLAKQQYETANKGRKYLSPSDAIKRRLDYGILRFAMGGFSMGFKAAFISGSIVLLSTHTAAVRGHFSSLYFPAFSALVGGVFAFPTGLIGAAKSFGLGISSGLTLSAVCGLYALSTDRTVDSAYWHLKKEFETELREEGRLERRITEVMEERNVWRYEAVKIVKEEERMRLEKQDT
ncbi:hypothetical protein PFISCL1PPCAC_15461, partial [Pristionchus fissidentatus]